MDVGVGVVLHERGEGEGCVKRGGKALRFFRGERGATRSGCSVASSQYRSGAMRCARLRGGDDEVDLAGAITIRACAGVEEGWEMALDGIAGLQVTMRDTGAPVGEELGRSQTSGRI